MNVGMVLVAVAAGIAFLFGFRLGLAAGERAERFWAPLRFRRERLSSGVCPICGAATPGDLEAVPFGQD